MSYARRADDRHLWRDVHDGGGRRGSSGDPSSVVMAERPEPLCVWRTVGGRRNALLHHARRLVSHCAAVTRPPPRTGSTEFKDVLKPNQSELLLSQSVKYNYRCIQICCSFKSTAIFSYRLVTIDRSGR